MTELKWVCRSQGCHMAHGARYGYCVSLDLRPEGSDPDRPVALYWKLRGSAEDWQVLEAFRTIPEAKSAAEQVEREAQETYHTLEGDGHQFNVTRERIRQIEANVLRNLKHPSRGRKLASFLDDN